MAARPPRDLPRPLLLLSTTVYSIVERFVREGRAAFEDLRRRGPKPLLGNAANERVQKLLEEDSPTEHGWLRSRWSCKLLALQLFRERATLVSRETLRRALHKLGFRWSRPRPVPPEKDSEEQIKEKRARLLDVLQMTDEAGSFFQDVYPSWRPTPKWACAGCVKENRSTSALRGLTARCGSAGRSTSPRGDSTGWSGSAGTTICSSGCSISCEEPTAATSSCTSPQTTTQAIQASG
jgi:transposase